MLNLKTGKHFAEPSERAVQSQMTRRDFGKGLASILAAGVAPSVAVGALPRGLGARCGVMGGGGCGDGRYQSATAVKSDGTAFCVFPGIHNSKYGSIRLKFFLTSASIIDEGYHYFGAHGNRPTTYFTVHCANTNIRVAWYNFGYHDARNMPDVLDDVHEFYSISNLSGRSFLLDGVESGYESYGAASVLNTHILLFAANANGVTGDVVSPHFSPASQFAVKEVDYWNGVSTSYQFRPVLDTNTNKYGFYDTDLDVFMGNYSTSGNLIGIT